MSRVPAWCTAAWLAVGLTVGCGGSGSSSKNDGGTNTPTQICTPNQATCVNDSTATICTANGLALVPVQCGVGEKCTAGACAADPNAPCTAADNTCMDSTHAVVCGTSGATSVACPANTTCQGAGLCAGACIVGSSACADNGTIATCADGNTYTTMACAAGMNCVATGATTAACLTSACTPDPNGCNSVCGDKTTGGTGTATNTVSTCVSTPTGYQWLATQCTAAQTCSPTAGSCNGTTAACASQCNPGDTRCDGFLGLQTCGTNGMWSATTPCNATPGTLDSACMLTTAGIAACGDVACVGGEGDDDELDEIPSGGGACDGAGNFHLCGPDGKVSATGTACEGGVACVTENEIANGYASGACPSGCTDGDQQCQGSSYQTCTNGLWGNPTVCTTGSCQEYALPSGASAIVCGACAPGSTRCVEVDGAPDQIETCAADGTWGAMAACAAGTCQYPTDDGNAACVTDCVPGKPVCVGDPVGTGPAGNSVWLTSATCTQQGTLPDPSTFTDCTATGTFCREAPGGASYGCVACVGTSNEFGLPDTICTSDEGGNTFVQTCKADNSGFDAANEVACTGNDPTCESASTNIPYPATLGACGTIDFGFGSIPATQSAIQSYFGTTEFTCTTSPFGNYGLAESCGSTPDCCSSQCEPVPAPTPAFCDAD